MSYKKWGKLQLRYSKCWLKKLWAEKCVGQDRHFQPKLTETECKTKNLFIVEPEVGNHYFINSGATAAVPE